MSLETRRLTLLPSSPEQLLALIDDPEGFETLLGLHAAEALRQLFVSDDVSPDWLTALRNARGPDPWRHRFFAVERKSVWVIGSAGFKGPPDGAGMVEIPYGVVPSREGRSYATAAAAALVQFAFASERVRLVRAHTRPRSNPSTRVLQKCGFRCIGEVVDPEDGPVSRWERGPDPME